MPPLRRAPLCLSAPDSGLMAKQDQQNEQEDTEEEYGNIEAEEKPKELKAEENKIEKKEQDRRETGEEESETESQGSKLASKTRSPPMLYLSVLSGADPELGPQLCQAAASGKNWSTSHPGTPQASHFSLSLISALVLHPTFIQQGFAGQSQFLYLGGGGVMDAGTVGRLPLCPVFRPTCAPNQHGTGPGMSRTAVAAAAGPAEPTPGAAWLLPVSEHYSSPPCLGKR